jgi:hypothetical protein
MRQKVMRPSQEAGESRRLRVEPTGNHGENPSHAAWKASGAPLSTLLAQRITVASRRGATVGDLLTLLDDRSAWGILLLLSLPMALPIPVPGASLPFGIGMALVAMQLAMGRAHPWLPVKLRNRKIGGSNAALVRRAVPALKRLEKIVHPRARWPAHAWTTVPVGAMCFLLSIIVALPVPFGNTLPGLAIALFSLGMMERDGMTLCLALAVALAGVGLIALASAAIYVGIEHWWKP